MRPTHCVAMGYASLDHKYLTAPFQGPGHTTLIRGPLAGGLPEAGASSYFASSLRAHGLDVGIVSWVGTDAMGAAFRDDLLARGIDVAGLSCHGSRSPSTQMFYDGHGESVVWFDPGEVDQSLTTTQCEVVARADALLLGIGPVEATARALDTVRSDALVLWAVKADPASLPEDLTRRLADRADVICHSESETAFLEGLRSLDRAALSRAGTIVVTTRGSRDVECLVDGVLREVVGPGPVEINDTTGAGDTFAGGLLARLVQDGMGDHLRTTPSSLSNAVAGACTDAYSLLRSRLMKDQDA